MGRNTVVRYGTDTSGRGIYMTRYMHAWLESVKDRPHVKPFADKLTVVQGAFMVRNGGGATASAGYHDYGGCVDFRTWNLTTDELNKFVVASRLDGGAAWRRDAAHGGMDPHCHVTLGKDGHMSSGAKASWASYLWGGNGLAGGGSDYEWRPNPIRYFKYKKKPKQPKRKKINLTHLLAAYDRPKGKVYNPWGKKATRTYHKALHKHGLSGKKWNWTRGWFDYHLRAATKHANNRYGIDKYTGKGDRPTWELCRKLGLAPYKVEKQRHNRIQKKSKTSHSK